MLKKIHINAHTIDSMVDWFEAHPSFLRQISLEEILQVLTVFMTKAQLKKYSLKSPYSDEQQQSAVINNIAQLKIGSCTRIDKRTLGSKPVDGYVSKQVKRSKGQIVRSFTTQEQTKYAAIIPRTLLIEKYAADSLVVYIMLGSKIANAYDADPLKISAEKDYKAKVFGGSKFKSEVIKIVLQNKTPLIEPKYMALVTAIQYPGFEYGDAFSLIYEANMQHVLAENCKDILDQHVLQLDASFQDNKVYVVSELGQEVGVAIVKNKAANTGLIKSMLTTFGIMRNTVPGMGYVLSVARGLCFLHSLELVHTDVKIDNVIVGDDNHARLIDFNLMAWFDSKQRIGTHYKILPTYVFCKSSNNPNYYKYFDEQQQTQLNDNLLAIHPLLDIWMFGSMMYFIFRSEKFEGTASQIAYLNNLAKSKQLIARLIAEILLPPKERCYLLASVAEIKEDMKLPVAERKYLSMEKIYQILSTKQYTIDHNKQQTLKRTLETADSGLADIFKTDRKRRRLSIH